MGSSRDTKSCPGNQGAQKRIWLSAPLRHEGVIDDSTKEPTYIYVIQLTVTDSFRSTRGLERVVLTRIEEPVVKSE
jgi:hypothetical protein